MSGNRIRIGLLDSGLGGISVLNEIAEEFSGTDFFYFADLKNSPYGLKDASLVAELAEEATKVLLKKDVKAIVVACNSATAVSIEYLREKYSQIPFIGMEPAIKPALADTGGNRIAVLATSLTLKEDKFLLLQESLNAKDKILNVRCDGLASLVDQGKLEDAKKYLEPILENLQAHGIKAVVLGCTHYVHLKSILSFLAPEITFYDGNHGTAMQLRKKLIECGVIISPATSENTVEFILNTNDKEYNERAHALLNPKIKKVTYV